MTTHVYADEAPLLPKGTILKAAWHDKYGQEE
jgi:hypothetical protein